MDMKEKKTGKGNNFPTNCREVQQMKDMEINEKIRYFRKQRGLSQELLAERTGINVNTIRKYEIGIRKPKVEQLKKIADGLEISVIEFLDIVLPYVSQALNLLDTGVARLQDYINPNTGTVVMACFPSLAEFAPELIVRYLSETNRVGVRLQFNQEATFMQLRDKLLAGEIDLVFCTKIDDPRVEGALIGEHQIVLLVPESHRLAQRESVDLRELDGEPFISFDNNCQLRSVTDELFQSLGIQPKITMETAQDVIMYGMVDANHGVAIVPRPLGGTPYNVKVLPIENEIPTRKLYIQWNKEQYMPSAAEYFRDFIIRSGLIFNHFLERHNLKEGS